MKKYKLQNLDCANCAAILESAVKDMACVTTVSVDFASQSMLIDTTDMPTVLKTIASIEPDVTVAEYEKAADTSQTDAYSFRREMIFLGISLLCITAALGGQYVIKDFPDLVRYGLYIAAYFITGWNVLYDALRGIINRSVFNENLLMTIATAGAFAIGAPAEAASVMIFFKIGELFQERALRHSRRSIQKLLEVRPDHANVKRNTEILRVSPETVAIGETVIVRPGEKIPLDGTISDGTSLVDMSPLTGESVPVTVSPGTEVLAGTINKNGLLTISVTRLFGQSSISKILELVENASHKKARIEKFITTFARYYTPAIVIIAALIAVLPPLFITDALFADWIYRALVVLVISCPCALVISIPLGYFGGIGGASKRGILVKGAQYLDVLASADTVVFDKTGTLTRGVFTVQEIVLDNGFSESDILMMAAHAESHSNHPIGQSIRDAYGKPIDECSISSHEEIGGYGVTAVVNGVAVMVGNDRLLHRDNIPHGRCDIEGTVAHVVINGMYAGYIVIGDEIKADVPEAIRKLHLAGIRRTFMLTGDNEHAAKHITDITGIDAFYAELLPEDKVTKLEDIMRDNPGTGKTVFVGDGINDAPVIARADVGIAMGTLGSDAAVETADIVIMNDSPMKIVEAVEIARKTRCIVIQNIILALSIKLAFIILGVAGISGMWEAVFADVGVALLAIMNAMRVLHR